MKLAHTSDALRICAFIEGFAPAYGAHVALTGGCLYKERVGRKDIDILFYTIRQRDAIDIEGLLGHMGELGFEIGLQYGWVRKARFNGFSLDLFFPEAYPATSKEGTPGEY